MAELAKEGLTMAELTKAETTMSGMAMSGMAMSELTMSNLTMSNLTLNIVTPKCTCGPFQCDSVHLTVCDDADGNGGGSCGIRKGHAKSLLSLEEGTIKGFRAGKIVLAGKSGCGFATVDKNVVTAVVEAFAEEKE